MKKEKISFLQMALVVVYVIALMISNVITSRQVQLPFDIVMTGGVFIFPITYILSDVFSEVYGYRWSRITCYISFLCNLFMVGVFTAVIYAPAPSYFTAHDAYITVLGNAPKVLFASFLAFVAGDFVNDRVFRKMKEQHPNDNKGFGFRAIASSLCGEVVDSLIFFPIAFLGQMPLATLATMMVMEVLIKVGYEVVILPVTRAVVKVVNRKEIEFASEC